MTDQKDKALAAFDAKVARERADLEWLESARDSLPESMRAEARLHRGAYGEAWATIGETYRPTRTLAEAAELLLSLTLLECRHLRSGTLSIKPEEMVKPDEMDRTTVGGTSVVIFELSGGAGFGPDFALVGWCKLGETFVKVSIPFSNGHKYCPTPRYAGKTKRSGLIGWLWRGHGEDSAINWWSTPDSYKRSFCWADVENFRAWLSHEVSP
jgi:hypothetical protein